MPSIDLAPDGVLAVEEAASSKQMKNWLLALFGFDGARHRGDAADVRLAAELGLEVGLVGAAHAGAGRVAALGHEAVDHAVEDDAVVEAFLGQLA